MAYDALDRLAVIDGTTDTKFAYDGLDTLAEYDGSNALLRRFVFAPGIDQPVVVYEGSGTSSPRFLSADERGSIITATTGAGALLTVNSYDEYGIPGASNGRRFQYTGQKWIGEAGLYDYKARVYFPGLGIFAQTDPIGYDAGANLYAYVLADPVNLSDPLGLFDPPDDPDSADKRLKNCGWAEILICANRGTDTSPPSNLAAALGGTSDTNGLSFAAGQGGNAAPQQQRRKPQPRNKPPTRDQLCRGAYSFALTALGTGMAIEEGVTIGVLTARWATAWGARGAVAGPLGVVAGAAAGGILGWALMTYGPKVGLTPSQLCKK